MIGSFFPSASDVAKEVLKSDEEREKEKQEALRMLSYVGIGAAAIFAFYLGYKATGDD